MTPERLVEVVAGYASDKKAINVVNGDSIQFTYDLTIQSGG